MIVVMKRGVSEDQIKKITDHVVSLGLKPTVIQGTERTVVAVVGDERAAANIGALESDPGVDEVLSVLAPYKLASLEVQPEPSVVGIGSFKAGGGHFGVMAGPCSVESEEQIIASAKAVKAAGATSLRGGAFKPRTSPYSFQGMKEDGLKLLAQARDETGLAVVTEVVSPSDVDLVAKYADILQIGARNMQNYRLLEEVGKVDRPVLLKRGASATMDEFLLAAEYILDAGNANVMLCERGIRTFEAHTRFTLPLASVPYLQARSHLPVIVDPSHGTGHTALVPALSRAAIAAGADGMIIEVHPNPEKAMSDGFQSLPFELFQQTMDECRKVAKAMDKEMA